MFNKNEIFETLTKIGFVILFFIAVMLVSLGIELDFKKLGDFDFWLQVAMRLIFTMTVFNMVNESHIRTKCKNKESRFWIAYATNKVKMNKIQELKLYDDVEKAVKEENESIFIKKCTNMLHSVSVRVDYQEVMDNANNLESLLDKHKIIKKSQKKRLLKIANKVISGSVKFKKLKDSMFLRDSELNTKEESAITYSASKDKLIGNMFKSIGFLLLSVLVQMLCFNYKEMDFWTWFITNSTLFFGALASGFYEANREFKLRTAMYEERNAFLLRKLNIAETYEN